LPPYTGDMKPVRRCGNRKQAEQYGLVLSAMGMRSMLLPEDGTVTLLVDPEDMLRADFELTAFESENRQPRVPKLPPVPALGGKPRYEAVLLYWAVLWFFFAAARQGVFGVDWVSIGAARATLITSGEWWRTITALCLHVDFAHLLGNLIFGSFIGLALAQVTGAGIAWLSMIVLGALGNGINAIVQSPSHNSIGASTAVFAGLGLLTALRQDWRATGRTFRLNAWAPMAGGITLLAFLGFNSDGRTDVLAHIFGFLAGITAGWLAARLDREWFAKKDIQFKCAAAAGTLLLFSWSVTITKNSF
jgi:rhomboid protease GluP